MRATIRNAQYRRTYINKLTRQCMLMFLLIMKLLVVFLLTGCFIHSSGTQLSANCGGEKRGGDDLEEGVEGKDSRGCSTGIYLRIK